MNISLMLKRVIETVINRSFVVNFADSVSTLYGYFESSFRVFNPQVYLSIILRMNYLIKLY